MAEGLRIVSLNPMGLPDLWKDIQKVAEALGIEASGQELIDRLKNRINQIEKETQNLKERPKVTCIEWLDPLMSAGNWVPDLVQKAGGDNQFGKAGHHSPGLEWDQVVQAGPDILIISPCGFNLDRTWAELDILRDKPGWLDLECVKNNRVFLIDGCQFFNRPGPRLVESLEILAEIINPEIFDFGHKGQDWNYGGLV